MVFMIANEKHDMKRYAVPVLFIPYHSDTDCKAWELYKELESVMVDLGMVVVGEFTCVIIDWSAILTVYVYVCVSQLCGKSLLMLWWGYSQGKLIRKSEFEIVEIWKKCYHSVIGYYYHFFLVVEMYRIIVWQPKC